MEDQQHSVRKTAEVADGIQTLWAEARSLSVPCSKFGSVRQIERQVLSAKLLHDCQMIRKQCCSEEEIFIE